MMRREGKRKELPCSQVFLHNGYTLYFVRQRILHNVILPSTYLLVPPLPPKTLDRGDWQEPRNGLSGTAWTHTRHSVDHNHMTVHVLVHYS